MDFEAFEKSTIWWDMMLELGHWLMKIHEELEDHGGVHSDKTLHKLGGNAEAIRYFKQLPETIRNNIQVQLDEDRMEREG